MLTMGEQVDRLDKAMEHLDKARKLLQELGYHDKLVKKVSDCILVINEDLMDY